ELAVSAIWGALAPTAPVILRTRSMRPPAPRKCRPRSRRLLTTERIGCRVGEQAWHRQSPAAGGRQYNPNGTRQIDHVADGDEQRLRAALRSHDAADHLAVVLQRRTRAPRRGRLFVGPAEPGFRTTHGRPLEP